MPAITRFGDADVTHCSGMTRQGKSSTVFINGLGVSRQGDNNTSHLLPGAPCPTHAAAITVGSTNLFADGFGVGRVGDAITGCTSVASGSSDVFNSS
jgi:uncharacterized Zn-binding protein involved in type VI secretion